MGFDDADEGGLEDACLEHAWLPAEAQLVMRDGVPGMSMVHQCRFCPAAMYEPSNVDRFPKTRGVDPRL